MLSTAVQWVLDCAEDTPRPRSAPGCTGVADRFPTKTASTQIPGYSFPHEQAPGLPTMNIGGPLRESENQRGPGDSGRQHATHLTRDQSCVTGTNRCPSRLLLILRHRERGLSSCAEPAVSLSVLVEDGSFLITVSAYGCGGSPLRSCQSAAVAPCVVDGWSFFIGSVATLRADGLIGAGGHGIGVLIAHLQTSRPPGFRGSLGA
ncbi:Uncharacterised protein [Mycobacteroides abscessus subsp. bolletii]|nr:Uncharacterised protein [Mycobacteroides abscessus subsp. bolletii]